ncbi:hypothetical protein ACFSCX_23945 [Bacillus salitolerans]|uniref:DUF998 domain-containing protein n=1 Tax=Bacillus salitolerans TaxID=1437434 RepID=A0ABW4LYB4_9BACI
MENSQKQRIQLFEGERSLVMVGLIGFILSLSIAIFIFFQGAVILPEGNMKDAFSFNAAIGIFILSIAAVLPFAGFTERKRKIIRWSFIVSSIYGYAIETIQNFRGLDPRFSRMGTVVDAIGGMVFGVMSLVLVMLAIWLTIRFLRMKPPYERPLLLLGIRYAFVSVVVANMAGIWMILLQDRFTGEAGNLIVLHGIGFHALQTLIIPAWLIEKTNVKNSIKKGLVHIGSIAWMLMIILIGIQTGFGRSVFEFTAFPVLGGLFLLVWFGTVILTVSLFLKNRRAQSLQRDSLSL